MLAGGGRGRQDIDGTNTGDRGSARGAGYIAAQRDVNIRRGCVDIRKAGAVAEESADEFVLGVC